MTAPFTFSEGNRALFPDFPDFEGMEMDTSLTPCQGCELAGDTDGQFE